ncbi:hypothetical protein AERO9AM_10344 [Aeromicrobium sp. 9AM]|nr:hypothetical protein AERO9AM_10344 [Aeromicrobium sp. 9AM]
MRPDRHLSSISVSDLSQMAGRLSELCNHGASMSRESHAKLSRRQAASPSIKKGDPKHGFKVLKTSSDHRLRDVESLGSADHGALSHQNVNENKVLQLEPAVEQLW